MTFYRKLEDMKVEHPEGFSPLQTLYPGRLMPVTEVYNRYNFKSVDPELSQESFEQNKEDTHKYASHLQKMERRDGEIVDVVVPESELNKVPPEFTGGKEDSETTPIRENFGVVGQKQDRLFIAVFGLLAILVLVKLN